MAASKHANQLTAQVLETDVELSLAELSRACRLSADQIIDLVEQGMIEPQGHSPAKWRFEGICVKRVYFAQRLKRDLGVNPAGAALALDLLEEIEQLRRQLRRFDLPDD